MKGHQEFYEEGAPFRPNRSERRRTQRAETREAKREQKRLKGGLPINVPPKTILVRPSSRAERWLRVQWTSILSLLENNPAMTRKLRAVLWRKHNRSIKQFLPLVKAEVDEVVERGAWNPRNMKRLGIKEVVCRCPGGVHIPVDDGYKPRS